MKEYFDYATMVASKGVLNEEGGPFGAVIVKNGKIVGIGNNKVLLKNDPTAHAEITAIRDACKNLNTYDLTGCIIYSTSEPCPMCLSAIIWSNIKEVYYATTRLEVARIGFRDNLIYDYLENKNKDVIKVIKIENKDCKELLNNYKNTKDEEKLDMIKEKYKVTDKINNVEGLYDFKSGIADNDRRVKEYYPY